MSDLEAKVREAVTDVLARKTKWGVPNMETRHVAEDVTTAVLAVVERPTVSRVQIRNWWGHVEMVGANWFNMVEKELTAAGVEVRGG